MKTINSRLADASARMEKVIILAGALTTDSVPEALDDFLEYDGQEDLSRCFPDMPEYVTDALDDRDTEAFGEWAVSAGKFGYLIQFATPVMRPYGTRGAREFSWGYYSTHWIYADTLEAAVEQGLAWAAEQRADEDRKAAEKSLPTT